MEIKRWRSRGHNGNGVPRRLQREGQTRARLDAALPESAARLRRGVRETDCIDGHADPNACAHLAGSNRTPTPREWTTSGRSACPGHRIERRTKTSAECGVARADNWGWSLYGAPWLQPVAISGKSPERGSAGKQAKSRATGCHQLRATFHGKEGVDGSSPSEGSAKSVLSGGFRSDTLAQAPACDRYGAVLWSSQVEKSDPGRAGPISGRSMQTSTRERLVVSRGYIRSRASRSQNLRKWE
jgi:hypothetical protein